MIDDIEWKYFKLIFKNLTIKCATNGKVFRLRHVGMMPIEVSLEDKEKIDEVYMDEDAALNAFPNIGYRLTERYLKDCGININKLSIEPYNPIARLIWRMFERPSRKVFRGTEG